MDAKTMELTDNFVKLQLAKLIYKHCQEYMKDPAHQKEFEEWYLEKHGYSWSERNTQHIVQANKCGTTS